jgi:hypothetical protein
MYVTLKTYAPDCASCSACSRENYQLPDPSANYVLVQKKTFIDSPELRRQRRGGLGIDKFKAGNVQKISCCDIREAFNNMN